MIKVVNSLIRITDPKGEVPPSFERVVESPAVYVHELSCGMDGIDVDAWTQLALTEIASLKGRLAEATLFVETEGMMQLLFSRELLAELASQEMALEHTRSD